jgi:aminoglycoside phosphotransferase (APT) family kinase protein
VTPPATLSWRGNLLPASVRDAFRAIVRVDDATWAWGRGRAVTKALMALPYYQHTNPALADNARHVIREILADHERGA